MHQMNQRNKNLGFQPRSVNLRKRINDSFTKREPNEVVIVHHIIDSQIVVQYEIERRSETLGILFERVVI